MTIFCCIGIRDSIENQMQMEENDYFSSRKRESGWALTIRDGVGDMYEEIRALRGR